jgi:hypothetical protein
MKNFCVTVLAILLVTVAVRAKTAQCSSYTFPAPPA